MSAHHPHHDEKAPLLTATRSASRRDRSRLSTYSTPNGTTRTRFSIPPTADDEGLSRSAAINARAAQRRQWIIRGLALVCACSLSVGAHYGREFLGPIKSRLAREIGSSNSDFSIILASYSVNNTWTPLIAGLLASRLGTARTSLLATSLIFGGQAILLLGRSLKDIGVMAAGLFMFGLGISPVSVVQETIIVRFFAKANLGIFLSIGLLLGKAAGFFSALSSFPLSTINPVMPFVVSTLLAAFSWSINVVYLLMGGWLAKGAGVGLEDWERERERKISLRKMEGSGIVGRNSGGHIALPVEDDDEVERGVAPSHPEISNVDEEEHVRHGTIHSRPHSPSSTLSTLSSDLDVPGGHQALHDPRDTQPLMLSAREAEEVVARKKKVILHEIVKLGDVFWLYLAFNFLCGAIWSPFTHTAANLFSVRYGYTEAEAGYVASFLHAGSLVLYPIAGYISDRSRQEFIVYKLALLSALMTLACYAWLLLPVEMTGTAMPGVILFGIATGFSTLLLVLMVPRIVPPRYVPTALGAHKSIESAGSTISVTLAGAILDRAVLEKAPVASKPDSASSPSFSSLFASPPPSRFAERVSTMLFSKGGGPKGVPPLHPTPSQKQAAWDIIFGFFLVNCISVLVITLVWRLDRRRRMVAASAAAGVVGEYAAVPEDDGEVVEPEGDEDEVEDEETFDAEELDEEAISRDMEPSGSNGQRHRTSSLRSTTPLIRPSRPSRTKRPANPFRNPSSEPTPTTIPSSRSRHSSSRSRHSTAHSHHDLDALEDVLTPTPAAVRRGKVFFALCALLIFGAWTFYVTTLVRDIQKRRKQT